MVEHRLAKARVAGSNPVSRSFTQRRHTQVVKGAVCKTAILRFESGCRLQIIFAGVAEVVDAWDLR